MADTENNKNSNSPALRFPGFTEPWQKIRLGDNCTIQMCKRIFTNQTSEVGEVPFFKIGTIGGSPDAFISRELFEEYRTKYSYPTEGEVMITCAGTVGKTMQFDGTDSYFQDSNIVWIHNPNRLTINDFLFYVFGKINWNKLNSTTITRIYNDDLRNLIYFAPENVAEQKKIVSLLRLIDERIATQRRLIEDLEKLKSSLNETLYVSLATDYKTSFYEIGSDYGGLTGKSAEDFGVGKPFISYLNVYQNQVITDCNFDYVDIRDGENQNKVQKGDLLFTLSSETPEEIGYSAVYLGDANELYLNSFCFGIHIPESEMVYPPYMGYLTSTSYFRREIIPYAQGSTRFNLHKPSLMSMRFSLPTKENQIKIFKTLQLIVEKISTEKEILCNFTYQRNYLLTKMFI